MQNLVNWCILQRCSYCPKSFPGDHIICNSLEWAEHDNWLFNVQAQPKQKLPNDSKCFFVNSRQWKKPRDENITGSSWICAVWPDHQKNWRESKAASIKKVKQWGMLFTDCPLQLLFLASTSSCPTSNKVLANVPRKVTVPTGH